MTVGAATARAFETICMREEDVLKAYTPGAFPKRGDVAKDATQQYVSDPLSVAAPRDDYFVTSDDRGRPAFTRDGSFQCKDGALLDAAGRPVFGFRGDTGALEPLRADAVDAALGFADGARIEPDGTVAYERTTVDPRTGARETQQRSFGRIALARFAPGTRLPQLDATHFAAGEGAVPHYGRPSDGNFAAVTPHRRESSAVDIDAGLQRLQEAYLALDALRAAHVAHGHTEKTAMDLLK